MTVSGRTYPYAVTAGSDPVQAANDWLLAESGSTDYGFVGKERTVLYSNLPLPWLGS